VDACSPQKTLPLSCTVDECKPLTLGATGVSTLADAVIATVGTTHGALATSSYAM